MSHTKVSTEYDVEGIYGSTEKRMLYCHHSNVSNTVVFYDEDGSVTRMAFGEWSNGNDLWDAMNRLWFPFKDKWGGELKDGVKYYNEI